MKKTLLVLLFILCWTGVVFSDENKQDTLAKKEAVFNLEQYRAYPFQWIFPEYYFKAEIIRVEKEKMPLKGLTKVEFFGLTACVPSQYTEEIKRINDIVIFKSMTGGAIVMSKSSNDSYMCPENVQISQKDYCSAYKTPQELFHKLYTLTPDTVKNTGDKWIVHGKGTVFENAKKIAIYSGDNFMAYVMFTKDTLMKDAKFSHSITLFHANGPFNSHVTITFLDKDDSILNHFISTIE